MTTTTTALLLTMHDVMERLRCSRATIYRLVRDEGFPCPMKVGNMNRWPADEVEVWLAGTRRTQ